MENKKEYPRINIKLPPYACSDFYKFIKGLKVYFSKLVSSFDVMTNNSSIGRSFVQPTAEIIKHCVWCILYMNIRQQRVQNVQSRKQLLPSSHIMILHYFCLSYTQDCVLKQNGLCLNGRMLNVTTCMRRIRNCYLL